MSCMQYFRHLRPFFWIFLGLVTGCMNTTSTSLSCDAELRALAVGSSSSCDQGDDSTHADDDSLSALPPGPQSLRDHFFLGITYTTLEDWDTTSTDSSSLPDVFVITLTQQTDMARLAQRSALSRLLQDAQESGSSVIIRVETFFESTPQTLDELTGKINHPEWASYYFNQLQSVIDISLGYDVGVLIIPEPHLLAALARLTSDGVNTAALAADTSQIYELGFLDESSDPAFAQTLNGMITATNYLFAKAGSANILHAWRVDLTLAPDGTALDWQDSPSDSEILQLAQTWSGLIKSNGITSYSTQVLDLILPEDISSYADVVEIGPALTEFTFQLYNETQATAILDQVPPDDRDNSDVSGLISDLYESTVTGLVFSPVSTVPDSGQAHEWLETTLNSYNAASYPIE